MSRLLGRAVAALALVSVFGAPAAAAEPAPFSGSTPRPASCAAGARPETGVQGEVTVADRASGRSRLGYQCNLSLVGQYKGDGASWVDPTYGHCAYTTRSILGNVTSGKPGVQVVDASDPAHPVLSTTLTSPAMSADTWESLKVNQARGLLAGVAVGPVVGALFFDLYDVKTDCAHPRLLNSVPGTTLSIPMNVLGHEGGWSPDGNTYWSSGVAGGSLTAIDVSDPSHPHTVWTGLTTALDHGFDISPDGNRLYMSTTVPAGFVTLDISQVQARKPLPAVHQISQASFPDSTAPQHTILVSEHGKPWIIGVDEIGAAGIHFVDITDPVHPLVHPGITLQIQQKAYAAQASKESSSDVEGLFGYDPHYCTVDRTSDPTMLACGYFQAGIRVFDIRDLAHPAEIAYYVPPGQAAHATGLNGSYHSDGQGDLAADWCTSPPSFVGEQLWVTCQDNGFLALQLARTALPAKTAAVTTPRHPVASTHPTAVAAPTVVSPPGSLAATGLSVGVVLAAGVLVVAGIVVLLTRRRRRFVVGGSAVVLVVAVLALPGHPPVRTVVNAADVAFARDMIEHHQHAVAMARAAETDLRTSPIDRAFAQQVDVEQSREIGLLQSFLRSWHQPAVSAHLSEITTAATTSAAQYNRGFLTAMVVHHQAAMPIIEAAERGADAQTALVARTMQVDQTLEIQWMRAQLLLGTQARGSSFTGR